MSNYPRAIKPSGSRVRTHRRRRGGGGPNPSSIEQTSQPKPHKNKNLRAETARGGEPRASERERSTYIVSITRGRRSESRSWRHGRMPPAAAPSCIAARRRSRRGSGDWKGKASFGSQGGERAAIYSAVPRRRLDCTPVDGPQNRVARVSAPSTTDAVLPSHFTHPGSSKFCSCPNRELGSGIFYEQGIVGSNLTYFF